VPELPEVEIVCRNLSSIIGENKKVEGWDFYRNDLRGKIPKTELEKLIGQRILGVQRRAKYILIELEKHYVLSHLGMTGSWRAIENQHGWVPQKHDHIKLSLSAGVTLVYQDIRRFGFVECFPKNQLEKRFEKIGAEPIDNIKNLTALQTKFKTLSSSIKVALMNQELVVGIGNIYASEILFLSKVSPIRKCSKVSHNEFQLIWKNSNKVLKKAIKKGGSTIENYKNSFGQSGNYQKDFFVYGRAEEGCRICATPIRQRSLGGRSTYWCPTCQK
jgi:formamidopyrimidine-DNA glycosylase